MKPTAAILLLLLLLLHLLPLPRRYSSGWALASLTAAISEEYCDVLAVGNRAPVECDAANNMADARGAVEQ
jgi:hypothetical protein